MLTKLVRTNQLFLCAVLACLLTYCSSLTVTEATLQTPAKDKAEWFAYRASQLELSLDQIKLRDESINHTNKELVSFDQELFDDSARRWLSSCAGCHGVNGKLKNVPAQNPAPRKLGTFGMTMGFTFGGDKMRGGIFKVIHRGKKSPSGSLTMPGWAEELSNEQIWGLVYFIEHGL